MNIYYVYIYSDPVTNVPFYVGYGKGNRCQYHIKEAQRNVTHNSYKLNKIRSILLEGALPAIQKIDSGLSKQQACELEEFLIELIGRRDLGQGPLANLTKGGDGNREWSPIQKQQAACRNKGFIVARDPVTGMRYRVLPDDPRWLSGELVGQNAGIVNSNINGKLTGYIQAKDSRGNFYRVRADDPRWQSGELVGVNKGKPAHPNTVAAAKKKKGIPKTKEHTQKVSATQKLLLWYCNFETGVVKRYKAGHEPRGFVRVSGPHKREIVR